MPEPQHQPLISSQTSLMGPAEGDRDSTKRALKVAGFTVLACALIAGQALTAYFLLSQKSQIGDLQDSADALKKQMTHRQSGGSSAGVMRMPMSSMAMMINDKDSEPKEPREQKSCVEQALEAGPNEFRPQCDPQGNFLPMQCQDKPKVCWCVKPDGQMIPGSFRTGKANCGDTARAMFHLPAMSGALAAENDE